MEIIEEWRSIKDYEGYEVSNLGRIRSYWTVGNTKQLGSRCKYFNPKPDPVGYLKVSLCREGVAKSFRVHVIVASHFLGPCPAGQEVRHKNGIRHECAASNLEYGTRKQNMDDKVRHGTLLFGSNHPNSMLDESDVFLMKYCFKVHKISSRECGAIFSCSEGTAQNIKKNKTWKHVPWPEVLNE
jgi:hypothetical protein